MALVRLFRREPESETQNPIHFDGRLTGLLKDDHRRLIRQLQQLRKLVSRGQYRALPAKLDEFRSLLQTHLMTENVRLYGYLSYALGPYSNDARRAADFRREMYTLGHAVMTFVRRYHETEISAETAGVFGKELTDLAVLLVRRIRREETELFPLYRPPHAQTRRAEGTVTPLWAARG
ncbi:MAG TPA: hemerythrin domain-containing protein [Acidiferrobacteraceae bacterium]|nr:hemerythrin domain-containing protein [Acidiferrobacteraceae bacterium]